MDNMEGNAKLEWMYKTGQDMVNREDYLLGKKVDKQFDEVTGNAIESEVLPFSIGRSKGDIADKEDQVDIVRKQIEDPLLLIKQKEIEARRKILENPVKLKKLHELLKKDKVDHKDDKPSKSSKDKKKKKKRSSSASGSDSDQDLDELLMKKYRALQGKSTKQDQSSDEANFIDKKFLALKKELDKFSKKKKKTKSRRRSSSSSPDRSRNQRRDRYDDRSYRSNDRRKSPKRRKSRSPPERRRDFRPERSERHQNTGRNPSPPPQKPAPSSRKRPSSSSSSDSDQGREKKRFGLVSASGEKISIKNKADVKWYSKDELKQKAPRVEQKNDDRSKKRPALTEAEKELKRREMMDNANWREKDRSEVVKKLRANDEKEVTSHVKEYDSNFLNRHLQKAQDHVGSVESRIKSNLNNIQRNSRTMDSNFARR